MNTQDRTVLIEEGKRIVERTDEDSWRLAEIVHELHEDGMSDQAIADELGWKSNSSAIRYRKALTVREQYARFVDALLFSSASDNRAAVVEAIAEAEGISPHTAKSRPTVQAVMEEIKDLPNLSKIEVMERTRRTIEASKPRKALQPRTYLDAAVSVLEMGTAIRKLQEAEPGWSSDVRNGVVGNDIAEKHISKIQTLLTLMQAAISDDFDREAAELLGGSE